MTTVSIYPAIRRSLANAGFSDIDGRWATVDLGDATLAIGGTSAPVGARTRLFR